MRCSLPIACDATCVATKACFETSDILELICAHLLLSDIVRLKAAAQGLRTTRVNCTYQGMCTLLQRCLRRRGDPGRCSQHCIDFHGLSYAAVLKYMMRQKPCMPGVHTLVLSRGWVQNYYCIPPCYRQLNVQRLVFPETDVAAAGCQHAIHVLLDVRRPPQLVELRLPIRCASRERPAAYVRLVMSGGIARILQAASQTLQVLDVSDSSICGWGWTASFDLSSIAAYVHAFPIHLRLL